MALRKEPERRYQSVEQFSEDIRRHLQERPVLARKDTMGYRATPFAPADGPSWPLPLPTGRFSSRSSAALSPRPGRRGGRQDRNYRAGRAGPCRAAFRTTCASWPTASCSITTTPSRTLPGATKVREQLLNDALNYLDSLARRSARRPCPPARARGQHYERVGDVRGGESSGSLGDVAGALGELHEGVADSRSARRREPQ